MRRLISELEEIILAGSGADTFREVFKLLYVKLYLEKYDQALLTYDMSTANFHSFFDKAKLIWPGVFDLHETISLPENLFLACMQVLQKVPLLETDLSIIDSAFEQLLPSVAKGNRGQYFTPRYVIAAMVRMLNPKPHELIIDPAAGSGGFLVEAIRYIGKNKSAVNNIYGIDFDERAFMVCKALFLIAGYQDNHVYRFNSLDRLDIVLKRLQTTQSENQFDIVLTNPPFGGEVVDKHLLKGYTLAYDAKGRLRNVVERHILFLERIIQLLKPGGRAAVVVPQGILNNTNLQYVRSWLFAQARILGVIGLDTNTFKPYTNVKTSVLLLQKWSAAPLLDYPIFMAVSQKSGKNASGDLIWQQGKIQSDLGEIADSFRDFVNANVLGF
jgi:type I restriction enzyme M protein